MDYSRPGTPTDNPFIESFNESFRDECLNTHWFLSLDDAYKKINDWVNDYNHYRPHSSLNELIPAEYVQYYQNKMIDGEILPEATDNEVMFIKTTKSGRINQKHTFIISTNQFTNSLILLLLTRPIIGRTSVT